MLNRDVQILLPPQRILHDRYYSASECVGLFSCYITISNGNLQADTDMDIRAGMIRELVMISDGLWFSLGMFLYLRMLLLVCV